VRERSTLKPDEAGADTTAMIASTLDMNGLRDRLIRGEAVDRWHDLPVSLRIDDDGALHAHVDPGGHVLAEIDGEMVGLLTGLRVQIADRAREAETLDGYGYELDSRGEITIRDPYGNLVESFQPGETGYADAMIAIITASLAPSGG
jgi:hypothetical protein